MKEPSALAPLVTIILVQAFDFQAIEVIRNALAANIPIIVLTFIFEMFMFISKFVVLLHYASRRMRFAKL